MATSRQEQIYNEIIEYYGYADRLIRAVEDSSHELSSQQFSVVEEVVSRLEECADKLTNQYIEFVKGNSSQDSIDNVRQVLNVISAKIEECRNKILMLYTKN
jgi:hypothetical protein